MAHYRKIDSRIQNDKKFCSLSDDGQLVFLLILTHPHLTALGAMRASLPGLAAEKKWSEKRYRRAFSEAERLGMVRYDDQACMIWLPNFLKYNHPESPNVVRSWAASLELLPECNLKHTLCNHVVGFLTEMPEAFREALPKAFSKDFSKESPKAMPNQEQEQEQKQKHFSLVVNHDSPHADETRDSGDESSKTGSVCPEKTRTVWPAGKTFPADFPVLPPDWFLEWASEACPDTDVRVQWPIMLDHEYRDKHTEWWRAARKWMRNAPQFRNGARASPMKHPPPVSLVVDDLGPDVKDGEF